MSLDSMGGSTMMSQHQGGGGGMGRMTHSLSTPSGVDGTSISAPHHRGGGKKLAVRVQMLDDSVTMFQVQVSDIFFKKFSYKCVLCVSIFVLTYLELLQRKNIRF